MTRTIKDIKQDVELLRREIRFAQADGDDAEAEMLYQELDVVLEELYEAQRIELVY